MSITPSTKRTTASKRAADKLAAAAVMLAEPADRLSQLRIDSAAASTVALRLAAADKAASFVDDADKAAWDATLAGRRLIGENMFEAFCQKAADADANTERKAASAVTFTTLMASLYGLSKADYEAAPKPERKGPGKRSWSALAEDYACFVVTTGDAWADAYDAQCRRCCPHDPRLHAVRTRSAEAEAARATEAGETSQAASARTKRERTAAAAAEAERQAAATEARKAERKAEADEAERKAADAATAILRHVTEHPSANLVAGVNLTCAEAGALARQRSVHWLMLPVCWLTLLRLRLLRLLRLSCLRMTLRLRLLRSARLLRLRSLLRGWARCWLATRRRLTCWLTCWQS